MVIPTPQPGHNCHSDTCHKLYMTQILTVCQPNNPQSTVCSKPNNAPHLKPSILQMSTEAGGWWWRYLLMLIKFRLNFVCVTLRTLCPAHGNLVFGWNVAKHKMMLSGSRGGDLHRTPPNIINLVAVSVCGVLWVWGRDVIPANPYYPSPDLGTQYPVYSHHDQGQLAPIQAVLWSPAPSSSLLRVLIALLTTPTS